jgi:hypothetical protein
MATGTKAVRQRTLLGLTVKDGYIPHPFDLEFGVRTSGLVAGRHLKTGHCHDRYATAYYGVAPSVFQAMLKHWQRSKPIASIEEFTFIDIGAGMGRAVLLASQLPFRAVHGVELHPTLTRIARRNVALWKQQGRAHSPICIHQGDACTFRFPAGPCIAFLFNPFGAPVMRQLLSHIAASFAGRPGELDLLYVNNEQERQIRMQPGLRRLFLGKVLRSRADARADFKILTGQPDGEYIAEPHEDCSIWRWVG